MENFPPKRTTSSHRLGSTEDLAWPPSPKLDVWHVPQVPLIHTNHSKLKLQPLGWYWRTRTCLWIPLRHGDFRLKKIFSSNCLDHWAPGIALITKSRYLTCPPGPIDPYQPFQPEVSATRVTLEAKNVPPNPPQTWGFQAKKDPLQRRTKCEQRQIDKDGGKRDHQWVLEKSKAHCKTCLSVYAHEKNGTESAVSKRDRMFEEGDILDIF